jgi:hypothetical protein
MTSQTDAFQYPPELFDLLIQTIPVLCRAKKDVLLFFRGAGVPENLYEDIQQQLVSDKDSINKYDIARNILTRINEKNESYLMQRRELLKRISEFESFSNCWPKDQFAARGYVSEVRKIIQTKDAFTRMEIEREKELAKHRRSQQEKINELNKKKEKIEVVKKQLYALFAIKNPQERGKSVEAALNAFFEFCGIAVREAFTISGDNGEGIIEQIDGVIELDNQVYLVEMKWLNTPVSNRDIHQHLGRMFSRPRPNGIFISASGYTDSAIIACKEAINRSGLIILMNLEEFVKILESKTEFIPYLREKILRVLIEFFHQKIFLFPISTNH